MILIIIWLLWAFLLFPSLFPPVYYFKIAPSVITLHLLHAKKHYFKSNNRFVFVYSVAYQCYTRLCFCVFSTVNTLTCALTDGLNQEAKKLSGIISR